MNNLSASSFSVFPKIFLRRITRSILTGSIAICAWQNASAASITWDSTATDIFDEFDVSTTDSLDRAYSFGPSGSTMVNGVEFTLFSGQTVDTASVMSSTNYGPSASPDFSSFDDLSPEYQDLVSNGRTASTAGATVTLGNLIVGMDYEIQVWMSDSRTTGASRTATIAGSPTLDFNMEGGDGGTGQFVTGTFTADATTQTMNITGSPVAHINALQLRVNPVIESGENGTVTSVRKWDTITINSGGSLTYSLGTTSTVQPTTTFAGAGTFTKTGTGTLTLGGASSDVSVEFDAGAMINVNGGTLVGSNAGAGDWSGNEASMTIASGAVFKTGDADVSIDGLNGAGTLQGGDADGGGILTVGSANGSGSFSGVLADATADGGTLSLTKAGTGTLTLSGANTYSGETIVTEGTLAISHPTALGTSAEGTTVNSGATLSVSSGMTIAAEALDLSGSGVGGAGALRNTGGSNSWAGNITLSSNSVIGVDAGNLNISSTVGQNGGTFGITKAGAGTLTLSGSSAIGYSGATTVSGGILIFSKTAGTNAIGGHLVVGDGTATVAQVGLLAANQIPDVSDVTVNGSNALLDVSTFGETISGLIVTSGRVNLGAGGELGIASLNMTAGEVALANGAALQVQGNATINASVTGSLISSAGTGAVNLQGALRTFDVADGAASDDLRISAAMTNGSLRKTGTGRMVLSGTNTYAGSTAVDAGRLAINGSISGTTVVVDPGATIEGSGTINSTTVTVNGKLAPGNSAGDLTVNGNLSFGAGSEFALEINGAASFDQLTLGPSALMTANGGNLTLSLNYAPAANASFMVIENLSGNALIPFANLADDAVINLGGFEFTAHYDGGDGNDLILVIPEPTSAMLLAGGFGALAGFRRRR